MTEFKVPELGENVTTGDVLRVLVNVGDTIEKDQPVVELETDKATVEVPSSVAGVVKEIKVKKGALLKTGSLIGLAGKTGRASGPHLHWGAVLHKAKLNPADLLQELQ